MSKSKKVVIKSNFRMKILWETEIEQVFIRHFTYKSFVSSNSHEANQNELCKEKNFNGEDSKEMFQM